MPIDFPPLRVGLYVALGLFSIVLLGLSGARIRYTTHLENGDPLNNGVNFYDPVVAELLFTSLVTFFWSIFMLLTLHKRWEHGFVSTFLFEIIVDVVLWLFWLGGAAAASHIWSDIHWCQMYKPCRILSALLAFAWLGWIVLTVLLVITILFTVANKGAHDPSHGRWDPDATRRSVSMAHV
jgi:hypothetical protein